MDHTDENERWGLLGEAAARTVYNLQPAREGWRDAIDQHGNPWESKICKRRVGERGDPGKYFIRWENHQILREEGGYYVFGLYDPQMWKHGPIIAMEVKPARWLDAIDTYAWTTNGTRRGETVIRPPWTEIFNPEDIPGETPPVATDGVVLEG